jgi:hypothetical protein
VGVTTVQPGVDSRVVLRVHALATAGPTGGVEFAYLWRKTNSPQARQPFPGRGFILPEMPEPKVYEFNEHICGLGATRDTDVSRPGAKLGIDPGKLFQTVKGKGGADQGSNQQSGEGTRQQCVHPSRSCLLKSDRDNERNWACLNSSRVRDRAPDEPYTKWFSANSTLDNAITRADRSAPVMRRSRARCGGENRARVRGDRKRPACHRPCAGSS